MVPIPAASSHGAFNSLPLELNKAIAHCLDNDTDIACFRLICRGTNDAIDADHESFWRVVFRRKFALKDGLTNRELKKAYQRRSLQLRIGLVHDFFRGYKGREKKVMSVLRDLIVDSFAGEVGTDEYGRPRCPNQTVLAHFVLNSKLLLNERRAPAPGRHEHPHIDPLLAAIKLMCSHFLFEREDITQDILAIEQSQRVVYMPTNSALLYSGIAKTDVNMEWFLHCLNFFRYHMVNEEVSTLVDTMAELTSGQKPSAWQDALKSGVRPLGRHWKGTYSFLEHFEITKFRNLSEEDVGTEFFIDKNVDEGKIQTLELDFVEGQTLPWPESFEDKLNSLRDSDSYAPATQGRSNKRKRAAEEAATQNIQFMGTGVDLEDDFNCIGWLNALPDQLGIPGWQRITFMKHFMDGFDQPDQDNLWAYEGVVLPGGRIILGRWWYASEVVNFNRDYNGPFILWATDEPEITDESDVDAEE